jgi:hypothetical protein
MLFAWSVRERNSLSQLLTSAEPLDYRIINVTKWLEIIGWAILLAVILIAVWKALS